MALVVSLELEEEESLHNAGQISFVISSPVIISSVTPTAAQLSPSSQASPLGQVISQMLGVGRHPMPSGTRSLGRHSPSTELVVRVRVSTENLRSKVMLTFPENAIISTTTKTRSAKKRGH